MCSERREDETSGRFASHGRLKEIGFATFECWSEARDAICKACSAETVERRETVETRREKTRRKASGRGGRPGVCMYGWWTGESLAGRGVDGVCREQQYSDAVLCEER